MRWRFMHAMRDRSNAANFDQGGSFLADPGLGAGAWYAPVLANLG